MKFSTVGIWSYRIFGFILVTSSVGIGLGAGKCKGGSSKEIAGKNYRKMLVPRSCVHGNE